MRSFTILAVLVLAILIPKISFGAVEISDGSVKALYHLEDVVDSSGGANNLTNNGSTGFVAGKLNNAVDFGGVNSGKYLYINSNPVASFDGSMSVSFWIKVGTAPALSSEYNVVTSAYQTTGGGIFLKYGQDGTGYYMRAERYNGTNDDNIFYYVDFGSTWHHVVYTYDYPNSKLGTLYVDGVARGTSTGHNGGTMGYSTAFDLGTEAPPNRGATSHMFAGLLDEVVYTNNVIATTTVEVLYNNGDGNEVCVSVGCASTSTSSSTPSSTAMTDFETFLAYQLLLALSLTIAIGSYIILT